MIDNPDTVGYYVGGAGLVSLIAQGVWSKFFSTEGKATDALTDQLSQRIAAQELRLTTLETGLDAEREARRRAEDKVHALEIDNLMLRAELRRHGIDVAAALKPDFRDAGPTPYVAPTE
jgi:hypothetical protein